MTTPAVIPTLRATDVVKTSPQDFLNAVAAIRTLVRDSGVEALLISGATSQGEVDRMLAELHKVAPTAVAVTLDDASGTTRPLVHAVDGLPPHLAEMLGIILEQPEVALEEMGERASQIATVTSRLAGNQTLAEAAPEQFHALSDRYRAVLLACLEQRAYQVTRDTRAEVIGLARDLASMNADPRDCIALQARVLGQMTRNQPDALVSVAREESTMLVIEVLGYLARAYRDRSSVPSGAM